MGGRKSKAQAAWKGRKRPRVCRGRGGGVLSLPRKQSSLKYGKSCLQSSPMPGRKPLELPAVGDSEPEVWMATTFSLAPLQCDCIWFGVLSLTFLLCVAWLYIGLILLNDLHNFNECVTDCPQGIHANPLPPPTPRVPGSPATPRRATLHSLLVLLLVHPVQLPLGHR